MSAMAPIWPLDRVFEFRGDTIRYRVEGAGPELVLVHGRPFSSYVWHRILPAIAAE